MEIVRGIKNYECRIKNYRRGNLYGYPFLQDNRQQYVAAVFATVLFKLRITNAELTIIVGVTFTVTRFYRIIDNNM